MIYNFGYWGYLSALALIAWVPISSWVFSREPPTRAAILLLMHASMWLPQEAAFDFPMIPALDKASIPIVCVVVLGYMKAHKRMRAAKLGTGLDMLVLVLLLGTLGTVKTNGDVLRYGPLFLPAMTTYDGISFALRDLISVGLPILAGRAFIRSIDDMQEVLRVMMVCGLIYTIPILWEIRMSPMLHINIYGFTSNTMWAQNVRDGGFRATAFMGHGLGVAFFMCVCTLAAAVLRVSGAMRKYKRFSLVAVLAFLMGIMVLQKSMASLIYTVFGLALLWLTSVKTQLRVSMLLCTIIMLFPLLRITGVFPTTELVELAREKMGEERAQSLEFRFNNEDTLLGKAQERPTFGWGGFARERVYDPETGDDLTIPDGMWIILYSTQGVWGFLTYFTLYITPIVYLWIRIRHIRGKKERALLTGVAVMLVIFTLNMLPNAEMRNIPLFLGGGLFVLVRDLSRKPKRAPERQAVDQAEPVAPEVPSNAARV